MRYSWLVGQCMSGPIGSRIYEGLGTGRGVCLNFTHSLNSPKFYSYMVALKVLLCGAAYLTSRMEQIDSFLIYDMEELEHGRFTA